MEEVAVVAVVEEEEEDTAMVVVVVVVGVVDLVVRSAPRRPPSPAFRRPLSTSLCRHLCLRRHLVVVPQQQQRHLRR